MARQMIFTSTPQGLEPGRTGFCTVARHRSLRSRLVRVEGAAEPGATVTILVNDAPTGTVIVVNSDVAACIRTRESGVTDNALQFSRS